MNLKSAAGTVCYVKDLEQTISFYEKLGFTFKTKAPDRATAYLNWWWFDFHPVGAADRPASHDTESGASALFYFSVDNVKQAYADVVESGLEPATEPIDLRGSREFMITDPDGNKLVFFKRK